MDTELQDTIKAAINPKEAPVTCALLDWALEYDTPQEACDALDCIDINSGRGPDGMTLTVDLDDKLTQWREQIDHVLGNADVDELDTSSLGQIVISVTEHLARNVACEMQDHASFDEWQLRAIEPDEDARHAQYLDEIAPEVDELFGKDDEPAHAEAFNNWTDELCKAGKMSDHLYNTIAHPERR